MSPKIRRGKPVVLNEDEREIEESIKRGEWRSVPKEQHAAFVDAAKAGVEARAKEGKKESINIRISAETLALLRNAADSLGLGYQTLIGSVIHRFAHGQLVERKELQDLIELLGRFGASPYDYLRALPLQSQHFEEVLLRVENIPHSLILTFFAEQKEAIVFSIKKENDQHYRPLLRFEAESLEDARKKALRLVRELKAAS